MLQPVQHQRLLVLSIAANATVNDLARASLCRLADMDIWCMLLHEFIYPWPALAYVAQIRKKIRGRRAGDDLAPYLAART
jgi:uncharacterized membrane protein